MKGRDLFNQFRFIIKLLADLISYLPLSIKLFLFDFLSIFPSKIGVGLRYIILRSMCKKIGDNVYVSRFVVIKNPTNLVIGNNVSIHDYCYIDSLGGIIIGDDVSIAHNCSIVSFEHSWSNNLKPIKYNDILMKPININSDVWIGCGSRILGGTNISNRVIIAAGAVVKGHLESNKIYAGIPAKSVREM